jgi:tetratricopeptide (TPR) repeat protein
MFNRLASLFGLGSKKLTPQSLEKVMEQALAAFQAGDGLRAEELVHATVEQAAAQEGRESHLYAQALFNEATVLCGVGDLARAAAVCRAAADVPAASKAAEKDRLTYLMNLGEILTRGEKLDEAEQVLREGLAEREKFYGVEHSGYAFGLAPLAENLLAQGRGEEALPLARQAVEVNWASGNEQVASDLALWAHVVKAVRGPNSPALDQWENLPPHMQQQVCDHCLDRATRSDPHAAQAVLLELRRRLQRTPDVDVLPLTNVNTQLANIARLSGDHEVRIEACRMAIKLCGGMDEPKHVINAWEGLAMALDDAGQPGEAEKAYRSALERAQASRQRRLVANVLRNYAIWLDEKGRKDEAAKTHLQAVVEGAASSDTVMHGRSLAASGIFHQHQGRRDQATQELQQALQLLPASHPDAFCAQSHLIALEQGLACMCSGDTGSDAISKLVEQMVRAKAGDLLKSLKIDIKDEGPDVKVELAREPKPAEIEHLNRVISQALAEMRTNYRRRGFAAD